MFNFQAISLPSFNSTVLLASRGKFRQTLNCAKDSRIITLKLLISLLLGHGAMQKYHNKVNYFYHQNIFALSTSTQNYRAHYLGRSCEGSSCSILSLLPQAKKSHYLTHGPNVHDRVRSHYICFIN